MQAAGGVVVAALSAHAELAAVRGTAASARPRRLRRPPGAGRRRRGRDAGGRRSGRRVAERPGDGRQPAVQLADVDVLGRQRRRGARGADRRTHQLRRRVTFPVRTAA